MGPQSDLPRPQCLMLAPPGAARRGNFALILQTVSELGGVKEDLQHSQCKMQDV